jgi:hypothetical protein
MEVAMRVLSGCCLAGLAILSMLAAAAYATAHADEIKPKQFPTGWNCATVPATERTTCEKTQIQQPKLEDPPSPPAGGNPAPLYPGGKLPPAAKPPSPKLPLPPPQSSGGNGS